MSHPNVLFVAELESLETRRNSISRSFFRNIYKPNFCLYHLIPPARDTSVTTRYHSLSKTRFTHQKYRSLIKFLAYIITNQQSDS